MTALKCPAGYIFVLVQFEDPALIKFITKFENVVAKERFAVVASTSTAALENLETLNITHFMFFSVFVRINT